MIIVIKYLSVGFDSFFLLLVHPHAQFGLEDLT